MFSVADGVPIHFAISEAQSLENAVMRLLGQAVTDSDGMDSATAYLCEFALDTANALRTAAGQTV
jgi:hypothetical protein